MIEMLLPITIKNSEKKCKKVLTKRERSDIIEKLSIGQGLVIEN